MLDYDKVYKGTKNGSLYRQGLNLQLRACRNKAVRESLSEEVYLIQPWLNVEF